MGVQTLYRDEQERQGSVHAKSAPGFRLKPAANAKYDVLFTHAYFLAMTRFEKRVPKPFVPLGPLSVAGYLRENGYKVRFYDTTFRRSIVDFLHYLRQHQPSLVGIYVTETTRKNALEMIKMCHAVRTPVVAGGPDPSADPNFYLTKGADFVASGEGEETMTEILALMKTGATEAAAVPGVHSAGGFGGPRSPIENIDTLPFPARDLVDYRPYFDQWRRYHRGTSMQMSVSRGCRHQCTFCSRSVFGVAPRIRSAENVAEEMLFIKMIYHPDRLWFADDIFGGDGEWVSRFAREVARKRAGIPFECSTRVDGIDREKLRLLKDAGCFRIWYGIESGSQKVLDCMKKEFSVQDIKNAVTLTREAGIGVGYTITLGHPQETIADLEQTRLLIKETRPDECALSIAYPLPGTAFYQETKSRFLSLRYAERTEDDYLITFQSRYSQNFYDITRNLIKRESYLCAHPDAGLLDKLHYRFYKLSYGIAKNGLR